MNKTETYQLNQWEPTDPINRADFNQDNAAIDAAIKAVAETAASKASAESVAAVEQSVASKANAADVNALSQTVSALSQTVNTHKIAVGSYTGNGGTQTVSVGFTPKVVIVFNQRMHESTSYRSAFALQEKPAYAQGAIVALQIVTGGFSVTQNTSAYCGVNNNGDTLLYLAIC